MDLLAKRYASPYLILDDMIHLGQLHEFILEVAKITREEEEEKYKWEFYLHKVFDMSYQDFITKSKTTSETEISKDEVLDIVTNSQSLLSLF